jgi:hypothetical protein
VKHIIGLGTISGLLALGLACGNLQPQQVDEFIVDTGTDAPGGGDPTDSESPGVIDPNNAPPRASAGPDKYGVVVGEIVTLDGSNSSDFDEDPLQYDWQVLVQPAGSVVQPTNSDREIAQLFVDRAGRYEVQLTVSDGTTDDADIVAIEVDEDNRPPVANAGMDQRISLGSVAQLSGAGSSDPDGDDLSYNWEITNRPAGSGASLTGTTVQPATAPRFTADRAGVFTLVLIVNDGLVDSAPDLVYITVEDPNSGGATGGGTSGGSSSCLDCAEQLEQQASTRLAAGDVASGLGLLALPLLTLFLQRRRED